MASKILASWNKANTTLQREEKKIRRHYASAIEATAKMPTYLGEWWFRKLEKLLTAHQELWQRAEKVVEWALKEEKNRLDAAEVQDVKEQADVFEFRRPIRPEILRIRRSRLPDLSQLEQAQRLLNASVAEQQMIVDEALVDASAIPAQAQARATRKQICPLAIKDGMVYVEGVPVPLAGSTMDGAIAAKFFLSVLIEQTAAITSRASPPVFSAPSCAIKKPATLITRLVADSSTTWASSRTACLPVSHHRIKGALSNQKMVRRRPSGAFKNWAPGWGDRLVVGNLALSATSP